MGCTLVTVRDHCYSSMPCIITNGDIGNNVQVHRISVEPGTMLHYAHKKECRALTVNSYYGQAPNPKVVPTIFEVSALSLRESKRSIKNRRDEKMKTEAKTFETFESRRGALIICT